MEASTFVSGLLVVNTFVVSLTALALLHLLIVWRSYAQIIRQRHKLQKILDALEDEQFLRDLKVNRLPLLTEYEKRTGLWED